ARRFADGTVDVGDDPAGTAYQMMMVVADPGLVPCDHTRRLDAPDQAHRGERVEHVVHGLTGDVGEGCPNRREDGLGVGVREGVYGFEDCEPGPGHTQVG